MYSFFEGFFIVDETRSSKFLFQLAIVDE